MARTEVSFCSPSPLGVLLQMQPRSQGPLGGRVGEDPGYEVARDVMLVHYSG